MPIIEIAVHHPVRPVKIEDPSRRTRIISQGFECSDPERQVNFAMSVRVHRTTPEHTYPRRLAQRLCEYVADLHKHETELVEIA
jgi:hypothetical protein